jgi:hypothetical protein
MTPIRRRRADVLLLAGLALSGLAGPAAAQWYGRPYGYGYGYPPPPGYDPREADFLSPGEIVDRVEAAGFDVLGRPRYTGRDYVVEATTRSGARVRLVVDAVRGRILTRTALGRDPTEEADVDDLFATRGPRYGAVPRGSPSPYDEMPAAAAPERRAPAREASRSEPGPARPEGALPAPSDPRLAPRTGSGPAAAPERRSEEPGQRSAAVPVEPGQVQGLNPDRAPAKPKAKPATPKSAAAVPNARPAAPEKPATAAAAPAEAAPAEPRKPVRVIEGVTPMTGGGQQSQPAPLNNVDVAKPAPPN